MPRTLSFIVLLSAALVLATGMPHLLEMHTMGIFTRYQRRTGADSLYIVIVRRIKKIPPVAPMIFSYI